jgi:preprotein translocase subunit SecG
MSLFIFLTVVQALVAAALVGVILIQKSEGGGLGVGGSPAGFMSARCGRFHPHDLDSGGLFVG